MATNITDVNGNASFTNVAAGSHTVTAKKDIMPIGGTALEHYTGSKTFTVSGDATVTLTLTKAYDLTTIGLIAGGIAVAGAALYAVTRRGKG